MAQHSNTSSLDKEPTALPMFETNGFNSANNNYHLGADESSDNAFRRIRTAHSVSISPELFEKMYLNPQKEVKGDLRKTFGNPTPLALIGFLLTVTPISMEMMGWRGAATGSGIVGAASVGACFFMGGLLMFTGGILECVLGNTFSFIVFASYGGFWLSVGITLTPSYNAYNAYNANSAQIAHELASPPFNSAYGFYLLCMGFLSLIFLICSLRTNIIYFIVFLTLVVGFFLEAGEYFAIGAGSLTSAGTLRVGAGISYFISVAAGWYILLAQMLAALDFPFSIPVGDISMMIKPASHRGARLPSKEKNVV
ncbi:MAG: hypothetical protein FRX48_09535 [Lasallia pustulata]|uniref:GPR1/FUN34/yaaH n=1 Tax=Lasallia pustulata TaxID=136370 RepID=A0A5M8PC45_9LECA|nr:MAG: hypothetical protein FRX48_09535 [Lasallia pustulata]